MPAKAAYNFITLPEKVLPSPMDEYRKSLLSGEETQVREGIRKFMAVSGASLSGTIELDVEALTPLFVGGTGERFFAPSGRKILPGSTLRGMVKNLLKIISCGAMRGDEDINDRHVYFRCLMAPGITPQWQRDLHTLYSNRMTNRVKGKQVKQAKQGILVLTQKGEYYVYPLLKKSGREFMAKYERTYGVLPQKGEKGIKVHWVGSRMYILTGSMGRNEKFPYKGITEEEYNKLSDDKKKKAGKQYIRYIDYDMVDWSENHRIPVPEKVILEYQDDTTRAGLNLLDKKNMCQAGEARLKGAKLSEDIEYIIPTGYLENNGEVSAFGHGLCFRIPYRTSTMDAVPKTLKGETIDFADAMFGKKELWASRVFFEDAEPVGEIEDLVDAPMEAHPMLQPKPTSFQLYLEQKQRDAKNWDDEQQKARLRGYKLYWHNTQCDWEALDDEKENMKNVISKIQPIRKGSRFHGRIRFRNLAPEELGALLMVFDLSGNSKRSAYKLGRGKALGLGSVRIASRLRLDSAEAYRSFFQEGRLSDSAEETSAESYLEAFSSYVEKRGMTRDWQDVMGELVKMLDWQHAVETPGWADKVSSMSGNVKTGNVDPRFLSREVLLKVSRVYSS